MDVRSLKRAARKLLRHYDLDLHDFPNLAGRERMSFLKTLFVRRYLERRSQDDEAWNDQIKVNSLSNGYDSVRREARGAVNENPELNTVELCLL